MAVSSARNSTGGLLRRAHGCRLRQRPGQCDLCAVAGFAERSRRRPLTPPNAQAPQAASACGAPRIRPPKLAAKMTQTDVTGRSALACTPPRVFYDLRARKAD